MTASKRQAQAEEATVFAVEDKSVIGIIHRGNLTQSTGVLLLVGGRQYRVGAHRQYVSLARHLSAIGYTVFRFDVRGMGDSSAAPICFLDTEPDIAAALAEFRRREPHIKKILLWGLCDGASAAILFASKHHDVEGIMMVNPWVTSDGGLARTRIKYYYPNRLVSADFWRKLLTGSVSWRQSVMSLGTEIKRSLFEITSDADAETSLPDKVFNAMEEFNGSIDIIISEKDLTAKEFEDEFDKREAEFVGTELRWNVLHVDSDHTFSTPESKSKLEYLTEQWVKKNQIR